MRQIGLLLLVVSVGAIACNSLLGIDPSDHDQSGGGGGGGSGGSDSGSQDSVGSEDTGPDSGSGDTENTNDTGEGGSDSGGPGDTGSDTGATCSPVSVDSSEIPAYTTVNPQNACISSQISEFVTDCLSTSATMSTCEAWETSNETCWECIDQSDNAGVLLRDPLVCFLHDARKPSHRA
jgi:hypothetical protein